MFDQLRGQGIDLRRRPHAGAECLELAAPDGIGNGLGHYAARGVPLRQKQHSIRLAFHVAILDFQARLRYREPTVATVRTDY